METQTKNIYNLAPAEVMQKFSSSPEGLTTVEVQRRIAEFGKNKIEKKQNWKWLKLIINQFNDALVWILLVAALFSILSGDTEDFAVLMAIVLVNALIGFFQEFKAEKILEEIQNLTSDSCVVIRDGKKQEINSELLVPGDIILVASGDAISADGYILEDYQLKINSFVFTGESRPQGKTATLMTQSNVSLGDVENMVFMGETVAVGDGKFIVTATGLNTELGHIAKMTHDIKEELTPMQKKIRDLGKTVTYISIAIAISMFAVGHFMGLSLHEDFLFALALAVSVVPEGLPATMSVALSYGMKKLLENNVLVKRLNAVETLGSVSIICTDKTGTLTRNELMVTKIVVDGKIIEIDGEGYIPKGNFYLNKKLINFGDFENLDLLFKIGTLCNDASLSEESGKYKIIGDPTEGAIIVAGQKYNAREKFYESGEEKFGEIPFSSERMMMSVVYKNDIVRSYVKGSPDVLINSCNFKKEGSRISPFTQEEKAKAKELYDSMSAEALRVLAFAYRELKDVDQKDYLKEAESNLVWVGMMAMIDPPRKDAREAIKKCKEFGIRSIMITGDYEITAKAIAEKIGLVPDFRQAQSINGNDLEKIDDAELYQKIMQGVSIFARIAPKQKLRIATVLKENGQTIAMTGDGVNDAPALKKADIGVAMGIMGTDVSKEAADMILTDDNFYSIVKGTRIGRTIYQNIHKIVYYDFTSNASALFAVMLGFLIGLPAPISAIQILAIDLGTDVFPCFALGLEPEEPGKVKSKLEDKILTWPGFFHLTYIGFLMAFFAVAGFFWSLSRGGWHYGVPIHFDTLLYMKSATVTYAVLAMTQMANLIELRNEKLSVFKIGFFKNKLIFIAIFISMSMLLAVMYVPFLKNHLHMSPIDGKDWIMVIGSTLIIFVFEEVRKFISNRKVKN